MTQWDDYLGARVGTEKLKKLNKIEKNRWQANTGAIQNVFGDFDVSSTKYGALYIDMMIILSDIPTNNEFYTTARDEARTLQGSF